MRAQAMRRVRRVLRSLIVRWRLTRERVQSGVVWNPLDGRYQQDPYATYATLLARDPVHRSRLLQGWVLSRHADIDAVLRDQKRFSNDPDTASRPPPPARLDATKSLLDLDPPDHTRLRALVSQAFTPRAIERLQPRIEEIVDALLDDLDEAAAPDVMQVIAWPLPATVIAEMLGVPFADRARFRAWSIAIARTLEPARSAAELQQARAAGEALHAYFEELIAERRAEPRDDLISALIAAEEAGDQLTHDELLVTLRLLLVAGHETTTNLIGNGLLGLLRYPEQLQQLRERPELMNTAIEELLRYDSPVQTDSRIALEDVTIGGATVRKGDQVILLLGAANRDPRAFDEPERLDLARDGVNHLSFARGVHYCLGAELARAEGQIAFRRLLERYPTITLAREPVFRDHVVLRGLRSLHVDVTSRQMGSGGEHVEASSKAEEAV